VKPGIIVTEPHLKEVIWGSSRLQEAWGKPAPPGALLGESWEISCVEGASCGVRGGGGSLAEAYARDPGWFLGEEGQPGTFPLLVKLLATSELLSLQVHPDDAQARRLDGQPTGKHEGWLVLEATDDAYIYLGVREGVGRTELRTALRAGDPESIASLLRRVHVQPGQVFDIAPGTLHALGPGLVLLEIQQPSDVTYRAFDWGRRGLDGKPRELHVDRALEVFEPLRRPGPVDRVRRIDGLHGEVLLHTPRFRLERWRVDGTEEIPVSELVTFVTLGGEGTVSGSGGEVRSLSKGTSCVIPRGVSMARFAGSGLDLAVCLPPA